MLILFFLIIFETNNIRNYKYKYSNLPFDEETFNSFIKYSKIKINKTNTPMIANNLL